MFKRVFVDANIFIDIEDSNRIYHKDSVKAIRYCLKNRINLYTSCDLITTIYYIKSKQVKNRETLLSEIDKINQICNVVSFSNIEIEDSLNLMKKDLDYIDLEDTIQYILALKESCDLILSNDKQFISKNIKKLSSNEFCKLYKL